MKTQIFKFFILSVLIILSEQLFANDKKYETVKVFSTSVIKLNNGNPKQVGVIEITDRSKKAIDVELKFPKETQNLQFQN